MTIANRLRTALLRIPMIAALVGAALSAATLAALPPTSPGYPDPTYGVGGLQGFGVRSGYESANAIVPLPDGKWLVSGSAKSAGLQDGVRYLVRLQPDGRFDPGFGTQGFVIDPYSSRAIAVQASGRILAAASVTQGGIQRGVLLRLLPDGSADGSFGTAGGRTVLDTATAGIPYQDFESLGHDGQGRIVATTRNFTGNFSQSRVEVWRFSVDGVPDPAFGTAGHVSLEDIATVAYNAVSRVQQDGKVVIATWCQAGSGTTTRACVIRLNPNGTRDAGFGPNGVREIIPPAGLSYPIYDLALADDGKIYVCGTAFSGNGAVATIFRLNADGTTDAGFGQGGVVKLTFSGETAYVTRVFVLPDGRLLALGSVLVSNSRYYGFVARLSAGGQLDPTFGNAGLSPTDLAQQYWFNTGAILADGAILAIGYRQNTLGADNDVDSLLARFVGVETTTPVNEFYNSILNHYFITADPVEAAAIDAGAAGPGWSRTGKTFRSGGPSRVCRLYGSPDINPATGLRRGPNSHVYSIEAAECLAIRADPGWRFERYDFSGWLRLTATCPAGTVGVYRAYNGRFAQNDSNHRYTTDVTVYNAMIALGWSGEGIVFCAV